MVIKYTKNTIKLSLVYRIAKNIVRYILKVQVTSMIHYCAISPLKHTRFVFKKYTLCKKS